MVDFFDTIYSSITDNNRFLTQVKFYSLQRFIIEISINILLPVYYRVTKSSVQWRLSANDKIDKRLIVSLTTFPKRIMRVWIVIESLLRQTHKPDKIILWLSREQFPSLAKLPKVLLHQQERGLEIRLCHGDIKSHKKYFYALKEFPEDILITVDDDIIYPTTMIALLVELSKKYPSTICCHRARVIKQIDEKSISQYKEWNEAKNQAPPGFNFFLTSGGGALFPSHSLHSEVLNESVFMKLCPFADDVWLNSMSRLNNTQIVKSDYYSCLLPVYNFHDVKLSSINVKLSENDKQINAVRNYYIEKMGIDFFIGSFIL